MSKASKKRLKNHELIIADLNRQFTSPTKLITKRPDDPPIDGEQPAIQENVFEVPVTEEDRILWNRRLEMMEAERERLMKELSA